MPHTYIYMNVPNIVCTKQHCKDIIWMKRHNKHFVMYMNILHAVRYTSAVVHYYVLDYSTFIRSFDPTKL